MILGIVIGILIALLIAAIGGMIYQECFETWTERLTVFSTIAFMLTSITLGGILGTSTINANIEKEYYGFVAIKETYNAAVVDEKISGLERLAITQTAIEQNKDLARTKVDMNKWYSFDITKENKDLILSLQPIGIE